MTKEYMDKVFNWCREQCPDACYTEAALQIMTMTDWIKLTTNLEFRAFASTGWNLWSRYDQSLLYADLINILIYI